MRRLVSILMVSFTTNVAHAQVSGPLLPLPVLGRALTPLGTTSTSVIDHNGNLLVFDVSYSYGTSPAAPSGLSWVKTRLTVITPDGTVKPSTEYTGALQALGVGWYAVYGILNVYPIAPATTTTRRLVALDIVAGVPLSPLPSIDAPIRAEIKLSPARDSSGPDLISFVDPAADPRILSPIARLARINKYSGGMNFVAGAPIPLP